MIRTQSFDGCFSCWDQPSQTLLLPNPKWQKNCRFSKLLVKTDLMPQIDPSFNFVFGYENWSQNVSVCKEKLSKWTKTTENGHLSRKRPIETLIWCRFGLALDFVTGYKVFSWNINGCSSIGKNWQKTAKNGHFSPVTSRSTSDLIP